MLQQKQQVIFLDTGYRFTYKGTERCTIACKATQKKFRKGSVVRIKDIAELWKNMMIKTKRIREVVCQTDLTFHADELLSIPQ